MKLSKKTLVMIILNLIILPLLGNESLNNYLGINIIVNIFNYILPFLLILFILLDMIKQKVKLKFEPTLFIIIIFWITLIISFIFSITYQIFIFSNLYKFLCMTFLLLTLKEINLEKKQIKFICYSVLIISAIVSTIGIFQYLLEINLNLSGIEKYIGALGRINSTTFIATLLDKFLVLNIFAILYFIYKKHTDFYISIIILILNVLALTFTFSRTGLLIFIFISILFIIIFIFKKRFFCTLILIFITIGIYFIPGEKFVFNSLANYFIDISDKISETTKIKLFKDLTEHIVSPFIIEIDKIDKENLNEQLITGDDYSLMSREYYKTVARALMKENWVHGLGIGSYTYIHDEQNANNYLEKEHFTEVYRYPHNMFLQLGAEIGIFGALLFFASFIYVLIYSSIKNKTIFPLILLISILLTCYTETLFYMKEAAYFTIILIALFANNSFLNKAKEV